MASESATPKNSAAAAAAIGLPPPMDSAAIPINPLPATISLANLEECLLLLQNNGVFSAKYTDIAEYLAVSYRQLMHLITEFCEEGILKRIPSGLQILDWKAIQVLAKEIHIKDQA